MKNYLSDREMQCHDGWPYPAEYADRLAELRAMFNPLRERWGKPLYVTSGYRTPEHNRKVGGRPQSQHLQGRAVDMTVFNAREWAKLRVDSDGRHNAELNTDELAALALRMHRDGEIRIRGIGLYHVKESVSGGFVTGYRQPFLHLDVRPGRLRFFGSHVSELLKIWREVKG